MCKNKLIERAEKTKVVCDNPSCDYSIECDEEFIILFVDAQCEKCGDNLLSLEDKVRNAVNLKHRFKVREVILFAPQDGTFKDVMTGSEITADMLMQYEHTLYDNKWVLWL